MIKTTIYLELLKSLNTHNFLDNMLILSYGRNSLRHSYSYDSEGYIIIL